MFRLTNHIKYQFTLPYYYYDDYNHFNNNNSNYHSDGCKGKDSNNNHDECKDNNNDDHIDDDPDRLPKYSSMYDNNRIHVLFESVKQYCIDLLLDDHHQQQQHGQHHYHPSHQHRKRNIIYQNDDRLVTLYVFLIDVLAHPVPSSSSLSSSSSSSSPSCSFMNVSSHQQLPIGIEALIVRCWNYIIASNDNDNNYSHHTGYNGVNSNSSISSGGGGSTSCSSVAECSDCIDNGRDATDGDDDDDGNSNNNYNGNCNNDLYSNLDSYELLLLTECCLNVIMTYSNVSNNKYNSRSSNSNHEHHHHCHEHHHYRLSMMKIIDKSLYCNALHVFSQLLSHILQHITNTTTKTNCCFFTSDLNMINMTTNLRRPTDYTTNATTTSTTTTTTASSNINTSNDTINNLSITSSLFSIYPSIPCQVRLLWLLQWLASCIDSFHSDEWSVLRYIDGMKLKRKELLMMIKDILMTDELSSASSSSSSEAAFLTLSSVTTSSSPSLLSPSVTNNNTTTSLQSFSRNEVRIPHISSNYYNIISIKACESILHSIHFHAIIDTIIASYQVSKVWVDLAITCITSESIVSLCSMLIDRKSLRNQFRNDHHHHNQHENDRHHHDHFRDSDSDGDCNNMDISADSDHYDNDDDSTDDDNNNYSNNYDDDHHYDDNITTTLPMLILHVCDKLSLPSLSLQIIITILSSFIEYFTAILIKQQQQSINNHMISVYENTLDHLTTIIPTIIRTIISSLITDTATATSSTINSTHSSSSTLKASTTSSSSTPASSSLIASITSTAYHHLFYNIILNIIDHISLLSFMIMKQAYLSPPSPSISSMVVKKILSHTLYLYKNILHNVEAKHASFKTRITSLNIMMMIPINTVINIIYIHLIYKNQHLWFYDEIYDNYIFFLSDMIEQSYLDIRTLSSQSLNMMIGIAIDSWTSERYHHNHHPNHNCDKDPYRSFTPTIPASDTTTTAIHQSMHLRITILNLLLKCIIHNNHIKLYHRYLIYEYIYNDYDTYQLYTYHHHHNHHRSLHHHHNYHHSITIIKTIAIDMELWIFSTSFWSPLSSPKKKQLCVFLGTLYTLMYNFPMVMLPTYDANYSRINSNRASTSSSSNCDGGLGVDDNSGYNRWGRSGTGGDDGEDDCHDRRDDYDHTTNNKLSSDDSHLHDDDDDDDDDNNNNGYA